MRRLKLFCLVAITVTADALLPGVAMAGGPWKGQIVDAEAGRPVEGVVVLFYWIKYTGTWAGWAGGEFHDSAEVVTDGDGRFVVPSRRTFTLVPWKKVSREIVIFKPGYGRWRFAGEEAWLRLAPAQRDARYEAVWKQFEGDGVVLELPPLKTREERLKALARTSWAPIVPPNLTTHLKRAVDEERANLGLPRMYERNP